MAFTVRETTAMRMSAPPDPEDTTAAESLRGVVGVVVGGVVGGVVGVVVVVAK